MRCRDTVPMAGTPDHRGFVIVMLMWAWNAPRGSPGNYLAWLASSLVAAIISRASAGSDFAPVFFMMEARWFSTVRWLMPRSAAMFLLGWPAKTRSMIWR